MNPDTLHLEVDEVTIGLAYLRREGTSPPLVCLHGFGSTKEDYADLALRPDFQDRELVFWDAPGFGATEISDPELSIPFLVKVAIAACDALKLEQFHLAGHSMGGLTALMLAQTQPDRVHSFIDIEGNVAPEDCFLSRQIIEHPTPTPDAFLEGFRDRVRQRPGYSSALYAAALPIKVRPTTFRPIFASMVDLSDNVPLMDIMAGLPCPRVFVHGEQNRHLSYLDHLSEIGVEVVEIPHSGHFPMYSNPPELWAAMAGFLARQEAHP
ncbi:MAG: alpha/beta hydrolase [Rhodobacteraceae bacterium]|nr:alpha/beta hydrolase [Paracoccaceae bacterium]